MTQRTAAAPLSTIDQRLAELPAIAILRATSARHLVAAAALLVDEGFTALEFPLTTPGAEHAVATARAELGQRALVGAGTVLNAAAADRALAAGAQFIVSPALCPDVVAAGQTAGVPTLPGAFTATEVLAATAAGASLVKLFPVNIVGPEYLAALRQPLPDLRAVPAGGVSLANAGRWLAAGAAALGLGSPLLADTLETGDLDRLRKLTRTWVTEIRAHS
jgi:2-dehydro-3-deoxyphosphogluconate aldolase/(4S)-4-hydroxy-2-oxoglutarate aldolase